MFLGIQFNIAHIQFHCDVFYRSKLRNCFDKNNIFRTTDVKVVVYVES